MVIPGPRENDTIPDLGGECARVEVCAPLPDGDVPRRGGSENGNNGNK